jgi:hypothetical protein
MSNTPETDEAVIASGGDWSPVLRAVAQRLERERDMALNAIHTYRCEVEAWEILNKTRQERDEAREAIIATLEENRHLTDGNDCTLRKLKVVVPDWK